jgi:hypothetical protein
LPQNAIEFALPCFVRFEFAVRSTALHFYDIKMQSILAMQIICNKN